MVCSEAGEIVQVCTSRHHQRMVSRLGEPIVYQHTLLIHSHLWLPVTIPAPHACMSSVSR